MKGKLLVLWVLTFVLLALVEPAMAQNEAFDMANERAEGVLDFLTGPIATTVLAVVLAIVGFVMMKGWIAPSIALSIITGGIIIGSASHIAAWLVGG